MKEVCCGRFGRGCVLVGMGFGETDLSCGGLDGVVCSKHSSWDRV